MPTMKEFIDEKIGNFEDDGREVEWLKAKELADTHTVVCIHGIREQKNPDNFGNYFWILEVEYEGMDLTIKPLVKIQKGSAGRDKMIAAMREALNDAHLQNQPDCSFHNAIFTELETRVKGRNGAIVINGVEGSTCPCTYLDTKAPF